MMELHQIISVTATNETDVFIASVEITDVNSERYVADYTSRPDDTFGLARAVRAAVDQWITDGKPIEPYVEPPAPPLPPLTARQLRLGLVSASILPSQVDAAITAIPDVTARAVAEIEWEYATQFERDHQLIEHVGVALGLTVEQIDAMWQAALEL